MILSIVLTKAKENPLPELLSPKGGSSLFSAYGQCLTSAEKAHIIKTEM